MASSRRAYDLITAAEAQTLPGLFLVRLQRTPTAIAYREFDGTLGQWRDVTWSETASRVAQFQEALVREGLLPGDCVAVLLANCVDWIAFDIAAMGLGLVTVPLYAHDSLANVEMILAHSDAKLL